MTLNSRNRLMKFFSLLSLVQALAFGALFIYIAVNGGKLYVPAPDINLRPASIRDFFSSIFSTYSFAALSAISLIAIYIPLVCYIVSYVFEKTQSPEVLYFLGFLIGCLAETFRFFIPILNLWDGYSTSLIMVGKTVFAGRLLTVLSFLFSALFSSDDKIQEADKNLLIAIAISTFMAYTVAIDTRSIHPSIMVSTAFQTSFNTMRIGLAVLTVITFMVKGKKKNVIPYLLLFTGYLFLIQTDNLGFAVMGALFLGIGTKFYFQVLHNYYLWK